ncbi:cysteine--tRNA ligase [Natranaerofaba carboxydovora]|uniref:cysteine--tRNA ligase n=1 Tax=Natranaerofaba carboxydovora TaxID=2742683 RepID=UPI003B849CE8
MRLFNSLKREKEVFQPVEKDQVKMYVCGPTVYDYFHVGNARAFLIFDVIRRYFEYKGYNVTYVQNFTDIEDKMINRANELSVTVEELADKFIEAYIEDARAIGIKDADYQPRATYHIEEIIDLINKLIEKGYAYESSGDVFFDISNYKEYGKLCKQDLEELESGARLSEEEKEKKKNSLDFVLWKANKPGEPHWDSPWGKGRPGWHIECSAMSMKYLGAPFDIHAGGSDLTFPHHENEIAQSEGATGKTFCNYWMHVGYLKFDDKKMSKSLGNFMTVREFRKNYDPRILRLFLLSAHYRSPLNYTEELLEQSKSSVERLNNFYNNLLHANKTAKEADINEEDEKIIKLIDEKEKEFENVMDDDFNTADALASVFTIVREVNSYITGKTPNKVVLDKVLNRLQKMDQVLGLLPEVSANEEILDEEIWEMIEKRQTARKEKDFATADAIRDELKEKGILIEDTPQGVRWKRDSG